MSLLSVCICVHLWFHFLRGSTAMTQQAGGFQTGGGRVCRFRRTVLLIIVLMTLPVWAADQPKEIRLWPNGAPGSEGKTGDEAVRITPDGEHVVSNVHQPSLTPYLPPKDKATGAAVIVAPGGGH